MRLVNTAIMKNPVNWIKVPLMAVMGMMALYLVAQLFTKAPAAVSEE